ncbi:unnamed protein product [Pylaiella littoralis]
MEGNSSPSKGCRSATAGAGDPSFSVMFPLISTEEAGGFQEEEAATVAVSAVLDFLAAPGRTSSRFPGLRVVLVAEEGSTALKALRDHASVRAEARTETRLIVKACTLPDMSGAGTPCNYIVNPCNWALAPGGTRANELVNRAAGDCLWQGSFGGGRHRAVIAEPIPVKLSPESPLRVQGVDTVIQVLSPNLDPRFPGCLADEPDRALDLLRQCYDNALAIFWELASSAADGEVVGQSAAAAPADEVTPAAATTVSAPAATTTATTAAATVVRKKASGTRGELAFPEYKKGPPVPARDTGIFWKEILHHYLRDRKIRREQLQNEVYYEDDQCLVIYDGYPKSRFHLLLVPKPKYLDVNAPSDLRRDQHIWRLRQLHAKGAAIAEALIRQGAGVVRCGYHGIPSLKPLHMHIISQDFESVRMKRINHWNGYTTDFFLEASWVEARLEEVGSLELDTGRLEDLEAGPLLCFRCGRRMNNMGAIKSHNSACKAPIPQGSAVGSGQGACRSTP